MRGIDLCVHICKKNRVISTVLLWLKSLSGRDAFAVKSLLYFMGGLFLYYVILAPSNEYKISAERNYITASDLLIWIQENELKSRTISEERSVSQTSTDASILSLVDSSANIHGIKLQRYEPNKDNGIRIWLEHIPFNILINWLDDLSITNNIQVGQINIDRVGGDGAVDVRIELLKL